MYQANKQIFKSAAAIGIEIRNESSQNAITLPAGTEQGSYYRFETGSVSGFSVKQKNGVLVILKNKN